MILFHVCVDIFYVAFCLNEDPIAKIHAGITLGKFESLLKRNEKRRIFFLKKKNVRDACKILLNAHRKEERKNSMKEIKKSRRNLYKTTKRARDRRNK